MTRFAGPGVAARAKSEDRRGDRSRSSTSTRRRARTTPHSRPSGRLNLAGKLDAAARRGAASAIRMSTSAGGPIRLLGDAAKDLDDAARAGGSTTLAGDRAVRPGPAVAARQSSAKRFDDRCRAPDPAGAPAGATKTGATSISRSSLWWAVEGHCGRSRSDARVLPRTRRSGRSRWSQEVVLERLMQRYALADVGETPGGDARAGCRLGASTSRPRNSSPWRPTRRTGKS